MENYRYVFNHVGCRVIAFAYFTQRLLRPTTTTTRITHKRVCAGPDLVVVVWRVLKEKNMIKLGSNYHEKKKVITIDSSNGVC